MFWSVINSSDRFDLDLPKKKLCELNQTKPKQNMSVSTSV